jgi:cephalosporin-C deacetylase
LFVDLPENLLRGFESDVREPADFDVFWSEALAEASTRPLDVTVADAGAGLPAVDIHDLRFTGAEGTRVAAWLRRPRHVDGPLPIVVQFMGYGDGRGHALRELTWAAAGFAHLVVDVRGQQNGVTPDPHGSGPSADSFLTRGIESPRDYFYRRVYVDAVRAVEAARSVAGVDPSRVVAYGASQGGGIALAMTALTPLAGGAPLSALIAQAPFLSDIWRASTITDRQPYAELARFLSARRDLAEQAQRTLAYVDGVVLARRATAPAHFSAGLMDAITPPSTVFAAHNAYAGPKELAVWPHNGHEAGGYPDVEAAIVFARANTATAPSDAKTPSTPTAITH